MRVAANSPAWLTRSWGVGYVSGSISIGVRWSFTALSRYASCSLLRGRFFLGWVGELSDCVETRRCAEIEIEACLKDRGGKWTQLGARKSKTGRERIAGCRGERSFIAYEK